MSYDFDYYSGQHLKAPVKPNKPFLGRNPTAIDARAYADAMEEYERELESYKEDASYYNHSRNALMEELKNRILVEYNLPAVKFDYIWSESYNRAHSGGLEEVFSEFNSLYNFIQTYNKLDDYQKGSIGNTSSVPEGAKGAK